MPDQWYVDTPAGPIGPLTMQQLSELASYGRLAPTHRISRDQRIWQPAGAVPGLLFPGSIDTLAGTIGPESPGQPRTIVSTEKFIDPNANYSPIEAGIAPGDRFGGYQVLDELGQGAMGVVYRARQEALGRLVALKTIRLGGRPDAKASARFVIEAQAVARLRHPNIVTAYDSGRYAEHVYYTMELLEGETLFDRLQRERRLPEPLVWQIVRQAAAGLAHAAAVGIVHRDIKPGNIFLTPPPTGFPLPPGVPMVKVTDFGLALFHEPMATDPRLTAVDAVMGTPAYMAPEQFAGSSVDLRADIYALGATAYEAMVGHSPFAGCNLLDLARLKASASLPDASRLSAGSRQLIETMAAANPADRPSNYAELLNRIDAILTPQPVTTPDLHATPQQTIVRRWHIPRWAWLVPLLGIVAVGAWIAWPDRRESPPPAIVVSGHAMFDGRSIAGWQPLRGEWQPSIDTEGGRVLAGHGLIRRSVPEVERLRATMSLDLQKASAAELQVAIQPSGSCLVLRVERERVLFGRRANEGAAFEALAPARNRLSSIGDGPTYVELKAERSGQRWWLAYDNQWLGSAAVAGSLPEFRLAAEGGVAHFESIEVLELR